MFRLLTYTGTEVDGFWGPVSFGPNHRMGDGMRRHSLSGFNVLYEKKVKRIVSCLKPMSLMFPDLEKGWYRGPEEEYNGFTDTSLSETLIRNHGTSGPHTCPEGGWVVRRT